MEIGLDSFVAATIDSKTGQAIEPARHLNELLDAITLADEVGLDAFGIGEHHRQEFLDSAPPRHPGRGGCSNQADPPNQCGDRTQRGRSGPGIPAICDSRPAL